MGLRYEKFDLFKKMLNIKLKYVDTMKRVS